MHTTVKVFFSSQQELGELKIVQPCTLKHEAHTHTHTILKQFKGKLNKPVTLP